MNATIRALKGLLVLSALAGLGLLLRWVTAGSIGAATAQDLTSMASVAVGAVAWVAYCWFVVAVLATVLEQVPGVVGRSASAVATRITSQTSRTLLRSALGVAAVTPLTIGMAQATPGDSSHSITTTRSTIQVTTQSPAGSRPWSAVEPRSTVQVSGNTHADSERTSSVATQPAAHQKARTPAGSRPWSAVEPASTVEVTGDSPADWRATEEASSVQIAGSIDPSATSTRTAAKPPAQSATGKTQSTQPASRSGAAVVKQSPTGRAAVPAQTQTGRTAVPEKGPVGEVAVPDRPTAGAPTRYTHLQSGQLARGASRVVKPSDSLWSIAAAELGPTATDEAIATRWPQWYAANRQLIGPNPDLVHPGQVLNPPAPSQSVPPTHQEK